MASLGQSLAGPRFHEMDEVRSVASLPLTHAHPILQWFDRQKAYLDSLESQLRGLVKAIDLVAKHRSGENWRSC